MKKIQVTEEQWAFYSEILAVHEKEARLYGLACLFKRSGDVESKDELILKAARQRAKREKLEKILFERDN